MVRIQDFFFKYAKERDCLKGFGKGEKRILTFKNMGWCFNFVVYEKCEYNLNKKKRLWNMEFCGK